MLGLSAITLTVGKHLKFRERTFFKPMSRSVGSRRAGGLDLEKFWSERDMPKTIPRAKKYHGMVGTGKILERDIEAGGGVEAPKKSIQRCVTWV